MDTQAIRASPPHPVAAAPAVRRATARIRRRAVLMVLGAAATFTLAAALVKALRGEIPLPQVIFCRNLFAIPALLPLLWRAGGLAALRPATPGCTRCAPRPG